MAKEKFRFLLVNNRPDTFPCANHTTFSLGRSIECSQPGIAFEMFQIYTSRMGVQPEIIWTSSSSADIGGYDDDTNTWTGAFAKVLNGTVDTLASTMSQTEIRDQYFDFSYPFYQASLVYMVRVKETSALVAAFDALVSFSPQVWLLYLAAIALLTVCLFAATIIQQNLYSKSKQRQQKPDYNYMLWSFFRYILDKSEGDMRQTSVAGNIILIFSGIAAIIMLSLYESSLLADLLTRQESPPFRTVEELAALLRMREYSLVFDNPFHWYLEELQSTSNSSHYALMRAALKNNPIVIAKNVSHALDLVRKGGYILPTGTDGSRLYQASSYCEIDFITISGTPEKYAQYIFRKNSTFHERFNAAVIATERLTNRAWQIYYGSVAAEQRAQLCQKASNTLSPLSLQALIGLFGLLLVGTTMAFLLFLTEIVRKCCKRAKKRNK